MMKKTIILLLTILVGTLLGCGEVSKLDGYDANADRTHDVPEDEPVLAGNTCEEERATLLALSNAELYSQATNDGVGNCLIQEVSGCSYCHAYVRITSSTWSGHGWPLNPTTRDSTGCVSTHCWDGYTATMCTDDLVHNAVAQLRSALEHVQDVCGICDPNRIIQPEMILD